MDDEVRNIYLRQIEKTEISKLVRSRMKALNLPISDYEDTSDIPEQLSYVIMNPSRDLELEEGDIM